MIWKAVLLSSPVLISSRKSALAGPTNSAPVHNKHTQETVTKIHEIAANSTQGTVATVVLDTRNSSANREAGKGDVTTPQSCKSSTGRVRKGCMTTPTDTPHLQVQY